MPFLLSPFPRNRPSWQTWRWRSGGAPVRRRSTARPARKASGARLAPELIDIGERVYLAGNSAGIAPGAWDSLRTTRVFLKAPITTPQGAGYKSLNVTVRKTEEDLYAGIEHRQTDEVYPCLKLITRPGCEKIVRYAFEYARAHGRKKVTCITKDNIMKMSDGLFHKVFDEIRAHYPEMITEHYIIDIGAARLATRPEVFDVIVTLNLYGDIISDIAAEVAGGVGLGGSANIGEHVAMFEAIHGSAPDIAGKDMANPSGLLLSAVMMLVHIGQPEIATLIHHTWLTRLEDGVHTPDLQGENTLHSVGTQAFADAVIARLGSLPQRFKVADYTSQGTAPALEMTRYVRQAPP